MKSIQKLVAEIGTGEVRVTSLERIETGQGLIIRVHAQSMTHPDVLSLTIDLPGEVQSKYDFQDEGRAWIAGWNILEDYLHSQ